MVDICHFMEFFKTRVSFEYFLGLAISDGHMSLNTRNRGKLQIELKDTDCDILEKLQDNIKVFTSISSRTRSSNFSKSFTSKTLRICDKGFRDFMIENGMPYGSKINVKIPVSLEFNPHFWRGFIDGDGSLGITSNNKCFIALTTKSEYVAVAFCKLVRKITGVKKTMNRNKRDAVYNFVVFNEDAQKLVHFLQYQNDISLNRKKLRAMSVLSWKRPDNMKRITWDKRKWNLDEDTIVISLTKEKAAEKLGRTLKSVSMRKWRLIHQ
jgi:hypothetical protein